MLTHFRVIRQTIAQKNSYPAPYIKKVCNIANLSAISSYGIYTQNIKEEELKNKVAQDYFSAFDTTCIVGNIDFCIALPAQPKQAQLYETESILWAEAKKGIADIYKSIVQLILTVGKARTFDRYLPPAFLGAFDAEKIAFIPPIYS